MTGVDPAGGYEADPQSDPTCGGCVAGTNPWHSHDAQPWECPTCGYDNADEPWLEWCGKCGTPRPRGEK